MNLNITLKPELICRNAINEGVRYLKSNENIKTFVLGISGGIDSAVTAAMARALADKMGIRFIGYILPIITNDEAETTRACDIAKEFCHEYELMDLGKTFGELASSMLGPLWPLEKDLEFKIRVGNLKARTRMMFLYDRARAYNGIVLSTDNYTELLLGFWTLHGDVGDYGFIQELWKTEVYAIGDYLADFYGGTGGAAMASCVAAKPTDGLGVSDSDIDQILPTWDPSKGSYRDAYRVIDETLLAYLKGDGDKESPVVRRYLATEYKRMTPVSAQRDLLLWVHNSEAA